MSDTAPKKPATSAATRGTMENTYRSAKDAAGKAIETTRGAARDVVNQAAQSAQANPIAVLAGGIAVGMLAGAFLPHSEQEAKLLGPVGKRLTDTAKGAAAAAKDAGKAELDSLGLNKDAARAQVGHVINGVLQALSSAGAAAASKAKE
ncbi:MAG: hypothetical protein JWL96_1083 [Sphingomonas bacterium]|uniref:hypothetical protein n=1 Tax=Sphingomonas bacterium TaxID=1895847 RepID=UPI002617BAB4|nr:hypothetical protein [Sphingomonas bacterium]MDB5709013.1 hypothetical protein [Sphingomonas bacterium]